MLTTSFRVEVLKKGTSNKFDVSTSKTKNYGLET